MMRLRILDVVHLQHRDIITTTPSLPPPHSNYITFQPSPPPTSPAVNNHHLFTTTTCPPPPPPPPVHHHLCRGQVRAAVTGSHSGRTPAIAVIHQLNNRTLTRDDNGIIQLLCEEGVTAVLFCNNDQQIIYAAQFNVFVDISGDVYITTFDGLQMLRIILLQLTVKFLHSKRILQHINYTCCRDLVQLHHFHQLSFLL